MLNFIRSTPFYKPLLWILTILIFLSLIWLGMGIVSNPDWFMGDDFVEYWAAGKLNSNGGNPYDPDQLHPLELQTGVIEGEAVLMWNPPWTLAIAMPLGMMSYPLSRILWMVVTILAIMFCINSIWTLYGGRNEYRWLAWIIGFTFVPILDGLKKGQTSALLLLGVVGFLLLIPRRRYWLAGVSLSLLTVKPHILYLFIAAVFLWSIYDRKWRVIFGFLSSLFLMTFISWIINPDVIQQYTFAIQNYPPADWATPTIGGWMRLIIGADLFWVQFAPSILGLFWLFFYWIRYRREWDWIKHSPTIILVSTLTTVYGWSWDQSVAILAILSIFTLILPFEKDFRSILIISVYILIDVLILIIPGNQFFTFWIAPALLLWYLGSRKMILSVKNKSFNNRIQVNP